MDLTRFEEAKGQLRMVRAELDAAKEAVRKAEAAVEKVRSELMMKAGAVQAEFFSAGAVDVFIDDDGRNFSIREDPYGGMALKVSVRKCGMLAGGKIQKLSDNDFELSTDRGRRLYDAYRAVQSAKRGEKGAAFARLFDVLCEAQILNADNDLVICAEYFVRLDGNWLVLENE